MRASGGVMVGKKQLPCWARGWSRIHFREGYLRRDQRLSWASRGLPHRALASTSICCTATAVDRKGVATVLLLKPGAGGVTLAGPEHWLPPNSRGETAGMTSPTKAESFTTPGLFLLSREAQVRMGFCNLCLKAPISKAIVCKVPKNHVRNRVQMSLNSHSEITIKRTRARLASIFIQGRKKNSLPLPVPVIIILWSYAKTCKSLLPCHFTTSLDRETRYPQFLFLSQ